MLQAAKTAKSRCNNTFEREAMRNHTMRPRRLLSVLLLAPCIALGGIKTNFERIGLRRIKFGGTFQLREPFRGVRAGRAADYLSDPLRVIAAACRPIAPPAPTASMEATLSLCKCHR